MPRPPPPADALINTENDLMGHGHRVRLVFDQSLAAGHGGNAHLLGQFAGGVFVATRAIASCVGPMNSISQLRQISAKCGFSAKTRSPDVSLARCRSRRR